MADNRQKRRAPQSGPQPSGPRRWLSIFFYAIAFVLIGYWIYGDKEGAGASKELSYTKLTAYIEAGAIEKIEVTDDLQAKATVRPQSYTIVFGSQGDGERAKGILRTQVPSVEEFSKYIEGVNANRKANSQAAIDVKYDKSRDYWYMIIFNILPFALMILFFVWLHHGTDSLRRRPGQPCSPRQPDH